LGEVLSGSNRSPAKRLTLFAWISLGLIESLARGLIGPSEAVRLFFTVDNCSVVRKLLGRTADEIMSRGVQLPDVFEALPMEKAHCEFQRELNTMRTLCQKLVDTRKLVA
jgi:hypothetical protein